MNEEIIQDEFLNELLETFENDVTAIIKHHHWKSKAEFDLSKMLECLRLMEYRYKFE